MEGIGQDRRAASENGSANLVLACSRARFYEIGTDRPIFADRDKSIHDNVEELSRERRMGYNWYNSGPQEALDRYDQWSLLNPLR